MSEGVGRVVPLTYGWEDLPESFSIYGGRSNVRLREPVPGVLLEIDGGWLLLDTGFNDALIRDPYLYRRFHGRNHDIHAELPADERDCLDVAFDRVGIDPASVTKVAVSHLHNDHAGGLRKFTGEVPVTVQARELEYGLSIGRPGDGPEQHGMFRIDYDDPAIIWEVVDGEADLATGVRAVPTYGHTPGHQSFVVTLSPASVRRYGLTGFVFAFDAADLQRNIDDELAVGGFIDCAPEQTVEAIRRLKSIAAAHDLLLVPGHDPHAWPQLTEKLGVRGP